MDLMEKRPRHRPVDARKTEAILAAARSAFFEKGFARTTMEAVAEAAGVSKVTVYSRFGTREALFVAVVENECSEMGRHLWSTADVTRDLRGSLIAFGTRAMGFLLQPHIIQFERRMMAESEDHPAIGELFLDAGPRRCQAELAAMLERAMMAGLLRAADSIRAAGHLYGLLCGFEFLASRFSSDDRSRHIDAQSIAEAVDAFLAIYALPSGGDDHQDPATTPW